MQLSFFFNSQRYNVKQSLEPCIFPSIVSFLFSNNSSKFNDNVIRFSKAKKSLNMDPIDMTEWNLPGDTKYPTFHKLSSSDFHHRVMHCRDAWIVLIYKGGIRK